MVARAKLYDQLDQLELELKSNLIPHLMDAADGNNDLIFCVSDFNQCATYKQKTDVKTESLIHIGRQILALRKKLGESVENTIAERICWYCRKWSEEDQPSSQTTKELAKQFLEEIERYS